MLKAVASNTDQVDVPRPVEELLRLLMVGKSESTRQTYQADIEAFGRFLGFQRPEPGVAQILDRGREYAYNLMLKYTSFLEEKGLQNASINKKLAPIRSLLLLGKNIGQIDWTVHLPYRKVQAYRDVRGPGPEGWRRFISEAEKRKDSLGFRNVAIFRLCHDMALRRIEVKRLDLADVDIINCRIAVLGKGCTQKVSLDVPPIVMAAIAAWIEARGTAPGPLFIELDRKAGGKGLKLRQESNAILPEGSRIRTTSFTRLVDVFGKRLGMKVTPHSLRHAGISAAVSKAAEIGVTIPEVMQFSRHKNLKTLQVYVDQHRNVQGRIAAAVAAS